ncbi:MAG: peroxiredoxin [Parvicella sp.]|jgi:peroxiredoxin
MKLSILLTAILLQLTGIAQGTMYDICPIKNSEKVPTAAVTDTSGESIQLHQYIGERPVVVVFYRGGWCPYCTRHLSALGEVKSQIDSLGFELIAITPDNFNKLDSSVIRGGGIDYTLFSDTDAQAMKAFGIDWKIDDKLYKKYKEEYGMDVEWWSGSDHHMLPVPSIFIIDKGIIQYQHVDPKYSQRLSNELLLAFITAVNE